MWITGPLHTAHKILISKYCFCTAYNVPIYPFLCLNYKASLLIESNAFSESKNNQHIYKKVKNQYIYGLFWSQMLVHYKSKFTVFLPSINSAWKTVSILLCKRQSLPSFKTAVTGEWDVWGRFQARWNCTCRQLYDWEICCWTTSEVKT
jgi:hypothetical protein